MTDPEEDNIKLGTNCLWRQQSGEEILGLFGTNLFQIADCVSVPIFLLFCWSSFVAFGKLTFQKLVTNQLFGLKFCAVRQDTFYPNQDYEQVRFYIRSSFYFLGWSIKNTENSQPIYNSL